MSFWSRCFTLGLLAAQLGHANTQLTHDGKTLFAADGTVSYGAKYDTSAIKAVIDSPEQTLVSIYTGKKPRRLFLNSEPVAESAWAYDDATGCIRLSIPAGRQALQARFDDLASIKPFAVTVPVQVTHEKNAPRQLGQAQATWSDGRLNGEFTWPEEKGGLFNGRLLNTNQAEAGKVFIRGAGKIPPLPGVQDAMMLQSGSVMAFSMDAADGKIPALQLALSSVPGIPAMVSRDRLKLLADPAAITLEGEKFTAERGGTISISTSHQNTSGGSCIYNWGTTGHALDWEVTVTQGGDFAITVVAACAESASWRSIVLNGQSIPGMALIQIPSTGGWGRSNAAEWQAFQPQDQHGKPIALPMRQGANTITISNVSGQHLNVDCLVIEAIKP